MLEARDTAVKYSLHLGGANVLVGDIIHINTHIRNKYNVRW